MVAGALHPARSIVTCMRDLWAMTGVRREDRADVVPELAGVGGADERRSGNGQFEGVSAGPSEDELFGDPFERPRESAR